MASHLELLKSINSFVVVIALALIGVGGYAGHAAQGHFNLAFVAMMLGVFVEVLACCGLVGAKLESVKMLVLYFWVLFVLIVGQVIVLVLALFRQDDVLQFVTANADRLEGADTATVVDSITQNLSFLAVCLAVLIAVQTVALMLASMHFKRSCLSALNSLSRFGGQGLVFVGIGVHLGSSATENEFAHAQFFGYLCMGVGAYLFVLGSIGVQGVKRESPSIIGAYFWLVLLTVVVEVIGTCLVLFKRERVLDLVRQRMSAQAADMSEKEIAASIDLVRSHLQVAAILAFLLVLKQALALVLSLKLRSELRGLGEEGAFSDLLDRELLDLLPGVAGQGRDLLRNYSQPSKWSDTYEQMRRKYDDFDDFR